MIDKNRINRHLTLGTFALAIVMFVMSMAGNRSAGNTERIAKNARTRVESRIEILEEYIERAAASEDEDFPCLEGLPEDMVIYTYVNDSLKSWSNQFSVLNDDISNKMVFQRLTNLRNRITSPLTEITDEYSYINLGPKWYIVKAEERNPGEKVICSFAKNSNYKNYKIFFGCSLFVVLSKK